MRPALTAANPRLGLKRRAVHASERLGVDGTAFRKRHDYVTAVSDADEGIVLHVADERTQASLPGWEAKIAFDKFHVAKYLGDQGTRHVPVALHQPHLGRQGLAALAGLGRSVSIRADEKGARTIKTHLWGILNAVVLKADNGAAEDLNSRIKMIKTRGRGFRNKARFRNAIYFHPGGLDLYPDAVKP